MLKKIVRLRELAERKIEESVMDISYCLCLLLLSHERSCFHERPIAVIKANQIAILCDTLSHRGSIRTADLLRRKIGGARDVNNSEKM